MSKFNLKKFLTENKLTETSKRLDEVKYRDINDYDPRKVVGMLEEMEQVYSDKTNQGTSWKWKYSSSNYGITNTWKTPATFIKMTGKYNGIAPIKFFNDFAIHSDDETKGFRRKLKSAGGVEMERSYPSNEPYDSDKHHSHAVKWKWDK